MEMRKMKIEQLLYDVITYNEFEHMYVNGYQFNGVAVDFNGTVYPIRSPRDTRPGIYLFGNGYFQVIDPLPEYAENYSSKNIIDFSETKSLRDVINAQKRLNEEERSILTSINNVTIPQITDNDEPAMAALKEAIIAKHIDIDSYAYKFGEANFPNDRRLLKKDSISLKKLIAFCNALGIKATLSLRDAYTDVPNPMGENKEIIYDLNFSDRDTDTGEE